MTSVAQRSPSGFFAQRVTNLAPSPTLAVSDKARQLKAQGIEVVHIQGRTRTQLHPYTEPARLVNGKLSYASDAGQGALPL